MDYEIFDGMLNRIVKLSIALESAQKSERANADKVVALSSERPVNVGEVFTLISAMASSRRIDAIKAYCNLTGMGLKESKDAIESVMDRERVQS